MTTTIKHTYSHIMPGIMENVEKWFKKQEHKLTTLNSNMIIIIVMILIRASDCGSI